MLTLIETGGVRGSSSRTCDSAVNLRQGARDNASVGGKGFALPTRAAHLASCEAQFLSWRTARSRNARAQEAVSRCRSNQPGSYRGNMVHAANRQHVIETGAAYLEKCRDRATYFARRGTRCGRATASRSTLSARQTGARVKSEREPSAQEPLASESDFRPKQFRASGTWRFKPPPCRRVGLVWASASHRRSRTVWRGGQLQLS